MVRRTASEAAPSPPQQVGRWGPGLPREPAPGSHLKTVRKGYTHHGIYAGNGRVIHYAGLHRGWRAGPVEEVPIEEFARGRTVEVVAHCALRYDREASVDRARSRLGESRYRLLTNNCEHFCNWCLDGEQRSEQVERVMRSVLRILVAATRGDGLVAAPVKP